MIISFGFASSQVPVKYNLLVLGQVSVNNHILELGQVPLDDHLLMLGQVPVDNGLLEPRAWSGTCRIIS